MNNKYALGIDIGGTNTAFGIVTYSGEIVYENSILTNASDTPECLVNTIYKDLEKTAYLSSIETIGIGAPNGNYFTGNIEFAPNLNWKGIIPIAKLFTELFNVPSVLTNDANAAAVGEMIFGVAKEFSDFVTITLGTGLGSGIIVKGNLIYGRDGFAGEYGHIRVIKEGRTCGCGRKGCLETYTSATGMVRSINELDSPNKSNSSLIHLENPTSLDISIAAQNGDPFAIEIMDFTAEILGQALADFACFSNPQAYVLFGGCAKSGQYFIDKIKDVMNENLLIIYKDKIDVVVSSLQDLNAAVLGSAAVAFKELEKNYV